jgi:hypothetical protein
MAAIVKKTCSPIPDLPAIKLTIINGLPQAFLRLKGAQHINNIKFLLSVCSPLKKSFDP